MAHLQKQQHSLLKFPFQIALAAACYHSSCCLGFHTYLIAPNVLLPHRSDLCGACAASVQPALGHFQWQWGRQLRGQPSAGGPYPHFAIRTRYCTSVKHYTRVDSQSCRQSQSRHVVALLLAVRIIRAAFETRPLGAWHCMLATCVFHCNRRCDSYLFTSVCICCRLVVDFGATRKFMHF